MPKLVSSLKTKIITPQLPETRAFYERCLGMRVVEEWQEEGDVGCILALPDEDEHAFLEVYEGEARHDFSGLSLQFRTDDLCGFQAALPADVEVQGPIKRRWGSTYLYLTDPNGISVVLFEGGL